MTRSRVRFCFITFVYNKGNNRRSETDLERKSEATIARERTDRQGVLSQWGISTPSCENKVQDLEGGVGMDHSLTDSHSWSIVCVLFGMCLWVRQSFRLSLKNGEERHTDISWKVYMGQTKLRTAVIRSTEQYNEKPVWHSQSWRDDIELDSRQWTFPWGDSTWWWLMIAQMFITLQNIAFLSNIAHSPPPSSPVQVSKWILKLC